MAVTATLKASGQLNPTLGPEHSSDGSLSAISVTSGNLLVVIAGAVKDGSATDPLTVSASGYTFTAITNAGQSTAFTTVAKAWRAPIDSTGNVTITLGDGSSLTFGLLYAVYEVSGHDTSTPIGGKVAVADGTTDGAKTLTLDAAPASADITIAACMLDADAGGGKGVTVGSGFTEDWDYTDSSWYGLAQSQQRTSSTSTSAGWDDVRTAGAPTTYSFAGLAFVLKASSGAATNANAGNAAGTGAAHNPAPSVAPPAGNAAGTGTAHNPGKTVAPVAGNAAGTGTAHGAKVSASPTAGAATGTGTAYNPAPSVAVVAGLASGTGTAYNPTADTGGASTNANAGAATGTGAAHNPAPSVAPTDGVASGTGAAHNAAVGLSVAAGVAAGTGTAHNPAAAVYAQCGVAQGTGTAYGATMIAAATLGRADGTGTAYGPVLTIAPTVGVAAGVGTAYNPTQGAAAAVYATPIRYREPAAITWHEPTPIRVRERRTSREPDE